MHLLHFLPNALTLVPTYEMHMVILTPRILPNCHVDLELGIGNQQGKDVCPNSEVPGVLFGPRVQNG